MRERLQELLNEITSPVLPGARSITETVRADRVYCLQMAAYRHGFIAGVFAGTILVAFLLLIAARLASATPQPTERARTTYALQHE